MGRQGVGLEAKAKQKTTSGRARSGANTGADVTRWANDNWRSLVAMGLAVVAGALARLFCAVTDVEGMVANRLSMATALTLLAGYAVGLGAYAAHTWLVFSRLDAVGLSSAIRATTPRTEKARRRQKNLGTSTGSWLQTAAGLALLAVAALIVTDELGNNPALVVGSLALVVAAWLLMAVSGTLLLARADLGPSTGRSLQFPGDGPPGWPDYTYVAVQLCTTFSSSDVSVTTTRTRRAVTSLAITAFLFNTVIVALLVSVLLSVG